MYEPLLIALGLGIITFYFEKYIEHFKKYDLAFTSFSSGMFIAYIFLSLFPEITKGALSFGESLFRSMWGISLLGFSLFFIIEKSVKMVTKGDYKKEKRLMGVRTFAFLINSFVSGIALYFFFTMKQPIMAYLSVIPILFHDLSSSLMEEHLIREMREGMLSRLLSAGSAFFGVLFATMLSLPQLSYYGFIAFITGILLYTVIRNMMPRYSKPFYFLSGIVYFVFILVLESLFV